MPRNSFQFRDCSKTELVGIPELEDVIQLIRASGIPEIGGNSFQFREFRPIPDRFQALTIPGIP
jgi:hypothetical protein